MMTQAERIDPVDVARINEQTRNWGGKGETIRPVSIDQVVVAEDTMDALPETVRRLGGGRPALMVVDRTPMKRKGEDLKGLLEERLRAAGPLTVRRLPDHGVEPFHAEIGVARKLAAESGEFAVLLSVGSGSITDTVKYARHLLAEQDDRLIPLISFATAASVTAYTSALAVLAIDGIKRTLSARAPDAVICDLRTLADAPQRMTQAGFGDVLARSVAYADWYIANALGMDEGFSEVPGRLLAKAERAMIDRAQSIAAADMDGMRCLTEAVLLAGMAMSLVNQTAPVSGWEHTISHFLDLTARFDEREPALHGAQVGVGTLVAARAYEQAWGALDPDRITADLDRSASRSRITSLFNRYDPSGRLATEVWRDYEQKLSRWNAAGEARRRFVHRKKAGELEPFIRANVRSTSEVADALKRVGAPLTFDTLTPAVPAQTAHAAIRHAHVIRKRFTFGDLLDHTGWMSDERAEWLLRDLRGR
jgi:glycerol-1-phosphate dehydrogenase [NAD(P)+]